MLSLTMTKTTLQSYIEIGATACQYGHNILAERMFKAAVAEMEESGKNDVRLVYVLRNIADIYRSQRQYKKASQAYKKAIAVCSSLGTPTQHISELWECLGEVGIACEQYDEAANYYRKAVLSDTLAGYEVRNASRLKKLAAIYFKQEKQDLAFKIFEEALGLQGNKQVDLNLMS